MIFMKLSTVVKAVRFHYAVLFVLLIVAVYWVAIHPWMTDWGSTTAERQMVLPGDILQPAGVKYSTQAITISAPPNVIWQWLVQIGQDRAGFYSYTWLENILGVNIHNTNEIRPEWQHLAVGDLAWRMMPADYLGGVGKDSARKVLMIEPNHTLMLEMWGAYVIVPIDEKSSRLIVRGEAMPDSFLTTMLPEPVVFIMGRRMLLGLKARAEGRLDAPVFLMAIAWLGWAAAGMAVASLFLTEKRRRYWLALPVVAALPALLLGHDIQAGLAAFIAAGITVLGFLVYGRNWCGSLLVIGTVVLLTLLLAPEAFTAIGFVFALLLLGTLVAEFAVRADALPSSPRTSTMP